MNYNSNDNPFKVDPQSVKTAENVVNWLAYFIYLAGALFATMAFYREVDTLFKDSTPILAALATIGAWANFASVALMWWAKKHWVTGGWMMFVCVAGWIIEILMMCANTLAAYGSTWTAGWVQISPVTPVYVIALWGVLALLHPSHKARQQLVEFHAKQQKTFLDMLTTAMESDEVKQTMLDGAMQAASDFAQNTLGVRIGKTNTDIYDKRNHQLLPDNAPRQNEPLPAPVQGYAKDVQVVSRVGENHSGSAGDNGANFTGPAK